MLLLLMMAASSGGAAARMLRDTIFTNWSQVVWAPESRGASTVFLGSPSIARAPDGALLASHDFFVQPAVAGWDQRNDNVSVYRSVDGGVEWTHVAGPLAGTYWAQLFVHRRSGGGGGGGGAAAPTTDSRVYLLGVHRGVSIVIRDGGHTGTTWGAAVPVINGSDFGQVFDVAPSPVVVTSGGRLSHACSLGGRPAVISARADADLMDPASWSLSEPAQPAATLPVPTHWNWPTGSTRFGEGALVTGAPGQPTRLLSRLSFTSPPWPSACHAGNGRVGGNCDLCTMHCQPRPPPPAVNKAAWFVLHQNGAGNCTSEHGCLVFDRLATVPGGQCKMAITYDEETRGYWSLGNHVTTPQAATGVHWWGARNNLTLSYSQDLSSWRVLSRVLYDDTGLPHEQSLIFTGFHYADMLVDGRDLLCLVRTAYRGAANMHDSNRITMKRVSNFRALLTTPSSRRAKSDDETVKDLPHSALFGTRNGTGEAAGPHMSVVWDTPSAEPGFNTKKQPVISGGMPIGNGETAVAVFPIVPQATAFHPRPPVGKCAGPLVGGRFCALGAYIGCHDSSCQIAAKACNETGSACRCEASPPTAAACATEAASVCNGTAKCVAFSLLATRGAYVYELLHNTLRPGLQTLDPQ